MLLAVILPAGPLLAGAGERVRRFPRQPGSMEEALLAHRGSAHPVPPVMPWHAYLIHMLAVNVEVATAAMSWLLSRAGLNASHPRQSTFCPRSFRPYLMPLFVLPADRACWCRMCGTGRPWGVFFHPPYLISCVDPPVVRVDHLPLAVSCPGRCNVSRAGDTSPVTVSHDV